MSNDYVSVKKSPVSTIGITQTGHHYWVGLCANGVDYFAGQTFKSTKKGALKTIRIFPEVIYGQTDALISVFEMDEKNQEWKEKKGECHLVLDKKMEKQWVDFDMKDVALENDRQYGFKISCNHGGMMAIAECSWKTQDPYPDGVQWIGSSENPQGNFHPRWDLAFSADIESN